MGLHSEKFKMNEEVDSLLSEKVSNLKSNFPYSTCMYPLDEKLD